MLDLIVKNQVISDGLLAGICVGIFIGSVTFLHGKMIYNYCQSFFLPTAEVKTVASTEICYEPKINNTVTVEPYYGLKQGPVESTGFMDYFLNKYESLIIQVIPQFPHTASYIIGLLFATYVSNPLVFVSAIAHVSQYLSTHINIVNSFIPEIHYTTLERNHRIIRELIIKKNAFNSFGEMKHFPIAKNMLKTSIQTHPQLSTLRILNRFHF